MSTRVSSFATKNYPLSIVVRIVEWKTQRLSFLPNNMVPVCGQTFLLHRVRLIKHSDRERETSRIQAPYV